MIRVSPYGAKMAFLHEKANTLLLGFFFRAGSVSDLTLALMHAGGGVP